MDKRKHNQIDPWDERMYGTGNTMPPKSHSGLIALLLMLVIFLSGVVSVLSFLNIKLFWELNEQSRQEEPIPMSFSDLEEYPQVTDPSSFRQESAGKADVSLRLYGSPQGIDNVPPEGGLSLQDIYTKNSPSVVSISCLLETDTSTGSGVIFSREGYIVTNYHVIAQADSITVQLSDGRIFTAVSVGVDKMTDLAVLYIEASDLQEAEFGDSHSLRVGDTVAAIGNPLGDKLQGTMTNGIVSAINRNVSLNGYPMELIQTNAALNTGNSGGPLINCYGQVIGINTMKIHSSDADISVEGVGFAIPSATVKDIVDQLISRGYVSGRPTLGLSGESVTLFDQYYFHIPPGLFLTEVIPFSDADKQNISPGDILISLDGNPILSQQDLDAFLYSHAIGDTLEAVIYQNGAQYTLTLTIMEATK